MHTCPTCHGSKEIVIHSVYLDSVNGNREEDTPIPCLTCKGNGLIDDLNLAKYIYHRLWMETAWCQCSEPKPETYFVSDFTHAQVKKHHYRCITCKKVTQIG